MKQLVKLSLYGSSISLKTTGTKIDAVCIVLYIGTVQNYK